jgi:hypothetical protein
VVMILNFAMSVWYPPCASVSVSSVNTSIDETGHGELTNGIHFQFPSILGSGLFDGVYKGKTLTFSFKFFAVSMSIFKWFRFLNNTHSGADG